METAHYTTHICRTAVPQTLETKQDKTPVTAADHAIQHLVRRLLNEMLPTHALIAEEDDKVLLSNRSLRHPVQSLLPFPLVDIPSPRDPERFWTLDPIDGTVGFLTGGNYAMGLALLSGSCRTDTPAVAGLTLPVEGVALIADTSAKSLIEFPLGKEFETSQALKNEEAQDCTAWLLSGVRHLDLQGRGPPAQLCCGSLVKYAAVATGDVGAFVQVLTNSSAHVWDHAAGIAVVRAAGGCVTDEQGGGIWLGVGKGRRRLRVGEHARAIVATGKGIPHEQFCQEVVRALEGTTG